MSDHTPLLDYLRRVPGIDPRMGQGTEGDLWWVKLIIDVRHPLAWRVVQELAHVLNYLSVEERLPAVFKPVSPPPYMNVGPEEYLSWVIESHAPEFTPAMCLEWLEGRLPRPVDDLTEWNLE